MLTTILAPTAGRFWIAGRPHTDQIEIRRAIGVLPESAGYPQHWTGEEYLRFYARLFGYGAAAAKDVAQELLGEVSLRDRGSSRIGVYSRGMRQRLGVARALVNRPRVIFLDEPTLGLDPAGQRQMLQMIAALAAQGEATVILSTHFLDEVEEVCSRVLILNRGSVIADGTVAEIKRRAAPKALRVRVDVAAEAEARAALIQMQGVERVTAVDHETGWLTADFGADWLQQHKDEGVNGAIRSLVDAGVPILALEREGGRLSDAFLALTEEAD